MAPGSTDAELMFGLVAESTSTLRGELPSSAIQVADDDARNPERAWQQELARMRDEAEARCEANSKAFIEAKCPRRRPPPIFAGPSDEARTPSSKVGGEVGAESGREVVRVDVEGNRKAAPGAAAGAAALASLLGIIAARCLCARRGVTGRFAKCVRGGSTPLA